MAFWKYFPVKRNYWNSLMTPKKLGFRSYYVDFSKAFGKMSHSLFTHKLYHNGMRGNTNIWIQTFLRDQKQAIVAIGEPSGYTDVELGVPVGSVLGPRVSLYYINQVPQNLEYSSIFRWYHCISYYNIKCRQYTPSRRSWQTSISTKNLENEFLFIKM